MSREFCSFPAVLLAMEEYHQPIWVWIIQRDYNIPDINFSKNFQKLSVFQIHYFIKYITFKNTKLSAALLNDTNKKQNIFTFIIIYLINRTVLPLQVRPSPVNPGLHLQRYDPSVLSHIASALQLDVPSAHSFISVKFMATDSIGKTPKHIPILSF